jgi:hypothetical protein
LTPANGIFGQPNQECLGYLKGSAGKHVAVARACLQQTIVKKTNREIAILYQIVTGVMDETSRRPALAVGPP